MRGSIAYQAVTILKEVEAIETSKKADKAANNNQVPEKIHSIATWNDYKEAVKAFLSFCREELGIKDSMKVSANEVKAYLDSRAEKGISLARMKVESAALGKMESGLNRLALKEQGLSQKALDEKVSTGNYEKRYDFSCRKLCIDETKAKRGGNFRAAPWALENNGSGRGYEEPDNLIAAIKDATHQLQAKVQLEAGCRAEGVGSGRCNHSTKSIRSHHLKGLDTDPVTKKEVGSFLTTEKGGKTSIHYCSKETYQELKAYIKEHGSLKSDYKEYLSSINQAAKETGQYVQGRGTHGLRYDFAQNRYFTCLEHGENHEASLLQTSSETNHNRGSTTLKYIGG